MNDPLRTIIVNLLEHHSTKKIPVRSLLDAVRRELPGIHDDFRMERRLLALLEELAREGALKLPSRKGKLWKRHATLPDQVTAIRRKADSDKEARQKEIHALRNETAWEPARMAAFAIHCEPCRNSESRFV
jgi:ABC-type phosphate transport system auxiliary subunit